MNESGDRVLAPRVRVMQIIAFALITGVLIFLGIACFQVFVQRDGQPLGRPQELPMLTIVAVVMLIGGATMSLVMPMLMTRAALQRLAAEPESRNNPANDSDKLLSAKQTALIVSMAVLEGPAFMGCIALLIEARHSNLGLVGIAIVGMVLRFPTQGGVRVWLYDQTNLLDQMRQGGHPPIKPR